MSYLENYKIFLRSAMMKNVYSKCTIHQFFQNGKIPPVSQVTHIRFFSLPNVDHFFLRYFHFLPVGIHSLRTSEDYNLSSNTFFPFSLIAVFVVLSVGCTGEKIVRSPMIVVSTCFSGIVLFKKRHTQSTSETSTQSVVDNNSNVIMSVCSLYSS